MDKRLWEKCAQLHGHECGGLTIGYKAALYIMELMALARDEDGSVEAGDELVCVAENRSCSVDGIRAALGCTEERGNLHFHLTNEQVFTVFNRRTREAVRIALRPAPEGITRENALAYYQSKAPHELFERMPVTMAMPEYGRRNETFVCEICGESGGSDWIRFVDGKAICLDCIAEQEQ